MRDETTRQQGYKNVAAFAAVLTSSFLVCLWLLEVLSPSQDLLLGLSTVAMVVAGAVLAVGDIPSRLAALLIGACMGIGMGGIVIHVLVAAEDPNWLPVIFWWLPAIL